MKFKVVRYGGNRTKFTFQVTRDGWWQKRLKVTTNSFWRNQESALQYSLTYFHWAPLQILQHNSERMLLSDVIIKSEPDYYHLWHVTLVGTRYSTNILTSKHRYPHFSKDQFMPLHFCEKATSHQYLFLLTKTKSEEEVCFYKNKRQKQRTALAFLSYRQCSPRSSKSDSTKLLPWNYTQHLSIRHPQSRTVSEHLCLSRFILLARCVLR